MQPYSLFFSGIEPEPNFEVIRHLSPHQLISYLYAKRKGKQFLANRIAKQPELKLLVDSGAHTFLGDVELYQQKSDDYWEEYLKGYTSFIRANRDHIFAAAELDIDEVVGMEKVAEWRERYFEPLEAEGIQILYIWHGIKGEREWENMCKKYSYVGFSYNETDTDFTDVLLTRLFNVARKYKAKVHGMAITGSELLSKFPFYTSDSSSWLTGAQYGEINIFDGRKLKRVKKDKWKTIYKNQLIQLGASWTAMDREDPYELMKMCAISYLEQEKYTRRLMKSKWYWNTPKKENRMKKLIKKKKETAENEPLPRGTLPSAEWFNGEMDTWKFYAEALGIDTEIEAEEACGYIRIFYDFITGANLDSYTTDELYAFCDTFGLEKKESNTRPKALTALHECFAEHARGERDEFSHISEEEAEESEATPRAKEREEEVEEPDYIAVDITKKECDSILSGFLPDPSMPEVEAYDAILKEQNVVVVRDEKGRFLKGQQMVRKPKKVISENMPKFSCDTCIVGMRCPDYAPGYVCKYNKTFNKFNTRDKNDLSDALHSMVQLNLARMNRLAMFEQMDTGLADPALTAMIDQNVKLIQQLNALGNSSVVATQRTVMKENGETETTTEVRGNPRQGGILSQLFSFNKPQQGEPIDVTADTKVGDAE